MKLKENLQNPLDIQVRFEITLKNADSLLRFLRLIFFLLAEELGISRPVF